MIPISGGMTERQVQIIADFRPDIIMVTPSYMLAIAEEIEKQAIDPKQSLVRDRISSPNHKPPTMRTAIGVDFGIDTMTS